MVFSKIYKVPSILGYLLYLSITISTPNIKPYPLISPIHLYLFFISFKPSLNNVPYFKQFYYIFNLSIYFNTSLPAAQLIGLPPYVLKCNFYFITDAISLEVATAAKG